MTRKTLIQDELEGGRYRRPNSEEFAEIAVNAQYRQIF
jgi:hypothetical protein